MLFTSLQHPATTIDINSMFYANMPLLFINTIGIFFQPFVAYSAHHTVS